MVNGGERCVHSVASLHYINRMQHDECAIKRFALQSMY